MVASQHQYILNFNIFFHSFSLLVVVVSLTSSVFFSYDWIQEMTSSVNKSAMSKPILEPNQKNKTDKCRALKSAKVFPNVGQGLQGSTSTLTLNHEWNLVKFIGTQGCFRQLGWIYTLCILKSFSTTQKSLFSRLKAYNQIIKKCHRQWNFAVRKPVLIQRKFNLQNWIPVLISCITTAISFSCLWNLIFYLVKNEVPILSVFELLD